VLAVRAACSCVRGRLVRPLSAFRLRGKGLDVRTGTVGM
jgi:hypothetical protein